MVDVNQQALADHVIERLERQVGIDRTAAVAEQKGVVMDLPRFAGLQHDARAGAGPLADEMVVQARDGQQRRDRRVVLVDAAVGQNDDVGALGDGLAGLGENPVQRFGERFGRLLVIRFRRKQDRQTDRPEFALRDVA